MDWNGRTNRPQATPSVQDIQHFQIKPAACAGIITRALRFASQLRSRGGGVLVMRALLGGITKLVQRRLREWSAHKIHARRPSVARGSRPHAPCWENEDGGEPGGVCR